MTPISERLRDHVQYSYVPAECRRSMVEAADIIEALVKALRDARDMSVGWSIDQLGPQAAVENVARFDAAIARVRGAV